MAEKERFPLDRAMALRETVISLLVISDRDHTNLRVCLGQVAPEDVAAILDDFEPEQQLTVFQALGSREVQAAVLEATDQGSRGEILDGLSEVERREVLGEMPVDDLVDHLEGLPADEQERLIANLQTDDAEDVRELRQYESETAGGMMTPEFLTVPATATSGASGWSRSSPREPGSAREPI